MKQRKGLCLLLAAVMIFALCSCGGEQQEQGQGENSSSSQTTQEPQSGSDEGSSKTEQETLADNSAQSSTSEVEAEPNYVPEYTTVDYDTPFLYAPESETITALEQPCTQQGTVVTLDYECPAYAVNEILGVDQTISKSVTVYLPYGYDESQQYDVLYLLHGTGGDNTYWLQGKKTGEPTCNVLDNMIQQGLCKPTIVVTPNFYSAVKGSEYKLSDETVVAYGQQINDSYLLCANDAWTQFFKYELRNDIMPLVESTYSTYAGGDTSEEGLTASRTHRAIAGLSRGAMTVARAGLMGNLDYFAYFGSFSGVWAEFDQFADDLDSSDYVGYPVLYWYNGNGTEDFSAENHIDFWNQVKEQMGSRFVDGENLCMVVKDGASHSYENWITDLYNAMLVFFTK
jgi:hypothetical protein